MKKLILCLALTLSITVLFAQRGSVDTDIFGALQYKSTDGKYKASLKKDIFDALIFTDSRNNKLEYEKKYLNNVEPGLLGNKEEQIRMLRRLVRENKNNSGYNATFKIDIFDKTIIQDNKGYKYENSKDIFGNTNVQEQVNGSKSQFTRNMRGGLEYTRDGKKATLEKDIFDEWIYKDSFGNEIQYNATIWKRVMQQFKNDEAFFWELIDLFFY